MEHQWSYEYLKDINEDYENYSDKENFFRDFTNEYELKRLKDYLKNVLDNKIEKMRNDKILKNKAVNYKNYDKIKSDIVITSIKKKQYTYYGEREYYYHVYIKLWKFYFNIAVLENYCNLVFQNFVL